MEVCGEADRQRLRASLWLELHLLAPQTSDVHDR
jgi:hypothetical protein